MFDVHNDSAPSNIMKLFTRTSNIHTYTTRSSTSQLIRFKYSRLTVQRKVFSRVGVNVWNELPNESKNLSKKSFKKERKRALLNILETEDSDMEPDEIVVKFKHSKIESNWTSSTIFFVHLETLGLFHLHNEHLSFSFFLFLCIFLSFYVIFLYFRFIFSVIKLGQ